MAEAVTSARSPEETLRHLDSIGLDWFLADNGDLWIQEWSVGAEGFVQPELVGELRKSHPKPPSSRALDWVSSNLDELRERFGGRWIAVAHNKVVADAATLRELLDQTSHLGPVRPFITEIPAEPVLWNTAYAG